MSKHFTLSGEQKSAIVLLSLNDNAKKALLNEMSDDEITKVLTAIKTLGIVNAEVVSELSSYFHESIKPNGGVVGEPVMASKIAENHLDENQRESLFKQPSSVWERLENLPDELLVEQLSSENAGLVAVVLSKLASQKLIRILPLFEPEMAREIIVSFTQLRPLSHEALEQVSNALDSAILSRLERLDNRAQMQKTISILEGLDPQYSAKLLEGLSGSHTELAVNLQRDMLTFEGLMTFSENELYLLLQDLSHHHLALALLDMDAKSVEFFLHHLSQNAALIVQEEMDLNLNATSFDIQQAKRLILEKARALKLKGDV